ncbi:MAG: hypothetical protein MPN21_07470 [Thermoanaerobaculia bacterium]|nr:hypothetical protein [Thermoanaerobaculia bacterium]
MMWRNQKPPWLWASMLVSVLCTGLAGPAYAAAASDSVPEREMVQSVHWATDSASHEAEGVFVFRQTPACISSRMHLETGTGDHVSLTFDLVPREGTFIYEFVDEASGWTVEHERQLSVEFEGSEQMADQERFLARVTEALSSDTPPTFEETIRVNRELTFMRNADASSDEDANALIESMQAEGFAAEMVHSAPSGARRQIREVRSQLCNSRGMGSFCVFDDILGLIDGVLSRYLPPVPDEPFPFDSVESHTADHRNMIEFAEGELKFLANFRSFDPERPLKGTCAGG